MKTSYPLFELLSTLFFFLLLPVEFYEFLDIVLHLNFFFNIFLDDLNSLTIGSGTGALAIFLRKSFNLDITTSDYDDQEIEENIAHNCQANGITPVLPHIKREFSLVFVIISNLAFIWSNSNAKRYEAIISWTISIAVLLG